jgi:hypothetical protein
MMMMMNSLITHVQDISQLFTIIIRVSLQLMSSHDVNSPDSIRVIVGLSSTTVIFDPSTSRVTSCQ